MNVSIDVSRIVGEERARLEEAINKGDFASLVSLYPVRETPALDAIVKKLGFQSSNQYESAVRKLLIDDTEALAFVRSLFGTLPGDIAASIGVDDLDVTTKPPTMVA